MLSKIKSFLFENTSTKQTIMKNTFWLILAEGVNKGSVFVVTILIARILGPEEFGVMSFVTALVSMFIVLTDFGLTTLMVREVSRDQSRLPEYLVNLSFLKVILGLITFAIVAIVSQWIGKPDSYISLILIYAGYAIVNNLAEFLRAFFRPSEQMQHEAYLKIGNGILFILIMGYILLTQGTLESIMYGFLVSGLIGVVVSITYVWKKIGIKKLELNKAILLSSLKSGVYLMGGIFFIGVFVNIDQIMLGYYNMDKDLGIYSAMYRILFVLTVISQIFAQSSIPNLLKNYSFHKVKKLLLVLISLSISSLIFILLFGESLIYFLYGNEYLSGLKILIILFATYIITSLNHLLYPLLNSLNKEKGMLYFTIIAGFLNIILNLIFIPKYQAVGAAITTLISETILFLLIVFVYHRTILDGKKVNLN